MSDEIEACECGRCAFIRAFGKGITDESDRAELGQTRNKNELLFGWRVGIILAFEADIR